MVNEDLDNTEELIENAKSGNRIAFSEIVNRNMNKIYALTYKMTSDKDIAADLTQDTFISAWEKIKSFKGDSKIESWLYRIAVNKTLNYLKKNKKQTQLENDTIEASENPEIDFAQSELKENIRNFTAALPLQQRIVFELHFYKELTFDEITKFTGKSLGTVKTLYREAIIKLRHAAQKKGWYHEL